MSLEHAPSRRGDAGATSESIAGDLLIGAEAIAVFIYGDQSQTRNVYRNVLGLPLFKHGAKLAATKSGLIEEIRSREKAAREELAAASTKTPNPRKKAASK